MVLIILCVVLLILFLLAIGITLLICFFAGEACVQKSIPLAVENDAVAERRNSEDEEWQKPEPAETKKPEPEKNEEKHTAHTAGFFMAKEVAKADPEFRRFLRDILADLDKEEG